MHYVVIAYFTRDTPYAEEVKNLINSLEKFNLPMDIVGISSQGNWQANTQYKPYFIKQMLFRHFPKDVLYLDADAIVSQHPLLFDSFQEDIGVVYRNETELLSGTCYFANKPNVMMLIDAWIEGCFKNPNIWDQQVLQFFLQEFSELLKLKIKTLPPTYCQIFDLMKDCGSPVIEQFQASRRFKEGIK